MVHRVRVDQRDAVFIISVAARLVEMHPSTLRKYEKCGLLEPCRQSGRLRLYSPEDIARLRQIKTLVEERGVNLAGVELALNMVGLVRQLRRVVDEHADDNQLRRDVRSLCDRMLELLGTTASNAETDAAESSLTPSS